MIAAAKPDLIADLASGALTEALADIAAEHGVVQSTVRSQIKALREKTGCPSIRLMMQRVNSLPPVVPALRIVSPMHHNAMEFAQP